MIARFTLRKGQALNEALRFWARSVFVENPGGQWLHFPSEGILIPPYCAGSVAFAAATTVTNVDTTSPPGPAGASSDGSGSPAVLTYSTEAAVTAIYPFPAVAQPSSAAPPPPAPAKRSAFAIAAGTTQGTAITATFDTPLVAGNFLIVEWDTTFQVGTAQGSPQAFSDMTLYYGSVAPANIIDATSWAAGVFNLATTALQNANTTTPAGTPVTGDGVTEFIIVAHLAFTFLYAATLTGQVTVQRP